MRKDYTRSSATPCVSNAGNSPKTPGVKLDQLPCEIISIIIDYLVIATDSIPPHTELDTFIQGCSGSRKPILSRVYGKSFASLMAVNKLFKQGIKLMITVDCGISGISDVAYNQGIQT